MSEYRVVGKSEIDIDEQELLDMEAEPGVEDTPIADEDFEFTPEQEAVLEEIEGSPLLAAEDAADEEELAAELISIATEKAMRELFDIQDRLEAAQDDHAEKAEVANNAKARVKSLQEDLSAATRRLREARTKSEPDPERYPLLDGRKAEVNAMFPKPEAIPPLPAEDFAEHYRRMARDTKLADLILSKRIVKAMEKAGYVTVADIGKLTDASAPLTSVSGIGLAASDEIIEALGRIGDAWKAEWDASHPEEAPAEGEAVDDGGIFIETEGGLVRFVPTPDEEGGDDA